MNTFVWDGPAPQYLTKQSTDQPNEQQKVIDTFDETLHVLNANFIASDEQIAIYKFIFQGEGNGLINAVAGSGKTTTLLNTLWFVPSQKRVLILSFNKSVQLNLQHQIDILRPKIYSSCHRQMAQCDIRTAHSHGLSTLRRYYPGLGDEENYSRDNKLSTISAVIEQESAEVQAALKPWKYHMLCMLKMLMNLGVDCVTESTWSNYFIQETAAKYGIPLPEYRPSARSKKAKLETAAYHSYFSILRKVYGVMITRTSGYDFSDQEYLPVRLALPFQKYDLILIDEAQDLSALQIEMISRSVSTNGRVIFVGDQNQSIYGFRGSLPTSMSTIARKFSPSIFPLTISWRCSQNVVEAARDFVPEIRARPNAPRGLAVMPKESRIMDYLRDRDLQKTHMILARTNAPLIELGLKLLQEGIPAMMHATTVCDNLKFLLRQVQDANWIQSRHLLERCKKFMLWKQEKIKEKGEEGVEKFDQLESLITIVKTLPLNCNGNQVERHINSLFNTNLTNDFPIHGCHLYTIHQAKGLEADCVYAIATHLLPHPRCKDSPWQIEQEKNAQYILTTRAKLELFYFVA